MVLKYIYLEEFGKAFIPQRFRPGIRKYLMKVGIQDVPYKLFGALFYLSLLLTYIAYMFYIYPMIKAGGYTILSVLFITFTSWALVQIVMLLLLISGLYFYWDMIIYNRTKQMEDVLIEFLQFTSENLKGGMPFDRALWNSIKPRFKVLATEVRLAAKKSMTGKGVEEALLEFTDKYNSPTLKRAFSLIVEGMKGGSEIADVIDRVVDDLKTTRELKEEMAATALTYTIFISAIVMVVSPVLFALAKQLLIILNNLGERLGTSLANSPSTLPIKFSGSAIGADDFTKFSYMSLGVIGLFASTIVSMIQYGNIKSGIKYIPLFMIVSIVIYALTSFMINKLFGGFFAGI